MTIAPYNTGRVAIGSCYVPPARPISSSEYLLQSVLLDKKQTDMHPFWRAIWRKCGAIWRWA